MKYTIDRFEGEYAVVELENKETVKIPVKALPEEAKEGDIIIVSVDNQETSEREKRIRDKFKLLFEEWFIILRIKLVPIEIVNWYFWIECNLIVTSLRM